jgi:nucleoside-diphosphate-sugar epimerase
VRRYFVTGATGVVGSALIEVLLEHPLDEVCALIRAKDDQDLARRVDKLFSYWRLGADEAPARRRLIALRGDTTAAMFGLSPSQYGMLCASVTNIVHAAGAVRMNLPLKAARDAAMGSAQQVIDLAWAAHRAGCLHKLDFVSTVGVGGRLRTVPEDWIDTARGFHNTYEQSKAEAEKLVRKAFDDGLPVTVHRPSMVVGNSHTGRVIHFQIFYHLCEFLTGNRTAGLFPALGRATIDTVPSDFVARLIAWSSRAEDVGVPILHAASGPQAALPLQILRQEVRRRLVLLGEPLKPIITLPQGLVRAATALGSHMLPDGSRRRALRTLPTFLDYLSNPQEFEVTRTKSVTRSEPMLEGLLDWPAYLPEVLNYYFTEPGRRN